MKKILIFILFSLTFSSFADTEDDFYNDLLDKHLRHGHLPKAQVRHKRLQIAKDKPWQSEFREQVRGVASTMKAPKNIIELNNPAIEISVK